MDAATGGVTLAGWLALWHMAAAVRPLQALRALRDLGVPDPRWVAVMRVERSPRVRALVACVCVRRVLRASACVVCVGERAACGVCASGCV